MCLARWTAAGPYERRQRDRHDVERVDKEQLTEQVLDQLDVQRDAERKVVDPLFATDVDQRPRHRSDLGAFPPLRACQPFERHDSHNRSVPPPGCLHTAHVVGTSGAYHARRQRRNPAPIARFRVCPACPSERSDVSAYGFIEFGLPISPSLPARLPALRRSLQDASGRLTHNANSRKGI